MMDLRRCCCCCQKHDEPGKGRHASPLSSSSQALPATATSAWPRITLGGAPLNDWVVSIALVAMLVVSLAAYLVFLPALRLTLPGGECQHHLAAAAADQNGAHRAKKIVSTSETSSGSLYKCELSYLQMDASLIKFSVDHLILAPPTLEQQDNADKKAIIVEADNFKLDEIAFNASMTELRHRTKLDPKLPFIFFINGFNTLNEYGEINGTWMFDVAKNLATDAFKRAAAAAAAKRQQRAHDRKQDDDAGEQQPKKLSRPMFLYRLLNRIWNRSKSASRTPERVDNKLEGTAAAAAAAAKPANLRANVIFLTWGIPQLLANNLFSMVPAYYKTVANYDSILDFVATTITKFIHYGELARLPAGWSNETDRLEYYSAFEFYGHSLGSHILSDAIQRVRRSVGLGPRFGKLIGLDPATPCFLSVEHGISTSKVSSAVDELVVIHSNAGLAGLTSERADIEVVLNGGTFQPGCAWYDFACHHARSTDIFGYRDDECQLVAYKCTSYHHFKTGACETCDQGAPSRAKPPISLDGQTTNDSAAAAGAPKRTRNCVLVNMPEQHLDSDQVLEFADQSRQARQLADNAQNNNNNNNRNASSGANKLRQKPPGWLSGQASADHHQEADIRARKTYYHYVNTSPNFNVAPRKSHCLQHYQLRLIVFNNNNNNEENSPEIQTKCRLSKFFTSNNQQGDDIDLSLLYEPHPETLTSSSSSAIYDGEQAEVVSELGAAAAASLSGRRAPTGPGGIQLGAIIRDLFYSALVTFERGAKLFVGAQVNNLDTSKLAACYRQANATSGPTFVLDIAFMSHIDDRVRRAYSSVLCGQLELNRNETTTRPGDGQTSPPLGADRAELELRLCKQAQLQNVSQQIDRLLEQIKLHRLDETWKVSLLNNLFGLFTQWEPF